MEAATVRRAPAVRAPARKAPARRRAPSRRPGGHLIPIAAGAATAVRQLPDSSLIVRMTSGRLWIGVLGVLLAGIVAVNVVTLSIAASAGHVDQNIAGARTGEPDPEQPRCASAPARPGSATTQLGLASPRPAATRSATSRPAPATSRSPSSASPPPVRVIRGRCR